MSALTVSNDRNILDPNSRSFDERANELEAVDKLEAEALKRIKNSPFSRWTQYNNERTKEMMWLALKHPKAHAILLFLVDQMDDKNAVMCSYKVLEEVLDVGHATIARNIKVLKDNGYLAVLKSGTSNVYAINDTVFWKSWGNNKQYSKFPANVILSLSEQEKQIQLSVTKHKEVTTKGE
jgi:DNA-binding transcriptional ArsR family regulator